jgi:hypothetical protein
LRVVLTDAARPGNLVLSCIEPISIRGLVRWTGSDLSVARVHVPALEEDGFSITDETNGIQIVCGGVEVAENVQRYSR